MTPQTTVQYPGSSSVTVLLLPQTTVTFRASLLVRHLVGLRLRFPPRFYVAAVVRWTPRGSWRALLAPLSGGLSASMVGTSAKLLAAAAAAHLLAVLRLLCIDLAQPPFTAILLPSELHHVSRSLLLVHRRALPQLNATLFSLAALPGAKELRITLWQPLHTSEDAAGEATARLLRSIGHLGLAISHLRPATCTPQTCRRLAAGSAAAMGGLRTAAAIMADKLVDGLDVAFAGEAASVVVMESGVELAPDALQFLDFAASLMHSARALALPGRVVLGTTACRLRAAHRDWRGRAASPSP